MMSGLNRSNITVVPHSKDPLDYAVVISLGVLAVFIFAANAFVIYLYLHRSPLRTITNMCLVFLAVSDLLAALIVIPVVILCTLALSVELTVSEELLEILLNANDLASRFVAISTILHLLIVSVERYIMIVFPMKYVKIVSRPRIKVCLVTAWCFSFTVIMIQLIWLIPMRGQETSKADLVYSMTTFFGIVVPAFMLIIATYYHIYREVCRQIKNIQLATPSFLLKDGESDIRKKKTSLARRDKRLEARAVLIFAMMLFTFVCGWFPYFIMGMMHDLQYEIDVSYGVNIVLLFIRFGVSLINPLLYTFLKADFRKALLKNVLRQQETELYEFKPNV